jgi:hypothetical protein
LKSFDSQLTALTNKLQHHMRHTYASDINRSRALQKLREDYRKVSKFPATEISQHVWDEMNELAIDVLIK